MRWLDTPPCTRMDVTHRSPERLVLEGPGTGQKLAGGATAAFGGLFATVGASFLRLPIPAPFKLVPLAFTAIGAGVAALGATAALASCSVEVARGEGFTCRWKLVGRDERNVRLPADAVEALEVTTHAHHHSSDFGDSVTHEYRLVAVAKDGRALELESFGTRTQANLRKQEGERVLG